MSKERRGEGGKGVWSFGRVLEEQTNQKQKQAEDKDMGLSGETKKEVTREKEQT